MEAENAENDRRHVCNSVMNQNGAMGVSMVRPSTPLLDAKIPAQGLTERTSRSTRFMFGFLLCPGQGMTMNDLPLWPHQLHFGGPLFEPPDAARDRRSANPSPGRCIRPPQAAVAPVAVESAVVRTATDTGDGRSLGSPTPLAPTPTIEPHGGRPGVLGGVSIHQIPSEVRAELRIPCESL